MPAYVIATMTVEDPDSYSRYTARTPAILARHGGRFLTRGDAVETLEGAPFRQRMVLIEFPDAAAARAFYADPEYQQMSHWRRAGASDGRLILQEGRDDTGAPDPKL